MATPSRVNRRRLRHLVVVLGDQLNHDASAFDDWDAKQDTVWMAEVREESTHVWTHKARIALFLAAMRHFRDELRARGNSVDYRELDSDSNRGTLAAELKDAINRLRPRKLVVVQPGEWRVVESLRQVAGESGLELEVRPDRHFLCSLEEFVQHAEGRKQLRLEYFYRELRRRHGILMDGSQPVGGKWNYDAENRGRFTKSGPGKLSAPRRFRPDATSRDVLALVERNFSDHPGELDGFDWPVTAKQAEQALQDFITHRLPNFGTYQDAMWTDEPYLYHSRISSSLNLKLLDPRGVIQAAVASFESGDAPLSSVEGFVRQILGWREYVRGVYWHHMPQYLKLNEFDAREPLPRFYWTGDTTMNCLRQAIGQTLEHGYAHHIQRLMVTGLFALLAGVDPVAVHQWYLAVYVDAVEWVELPNSLGMSQFADGGLMSSKPYIATGKYIQRMSNYCQGCKFDPGVAVGEHACPFTSLYWDFLARHRRRLEGNPRMTMQLKNLDRKDPGELEAISARSETLRSEWRAS